MIQRFSVLPFYTKPEQISILCECRKNWLDFVLCKLYTPNNSFLPFICPINIVTTQGIFEVIIRNIYGTEIQRIPSKSIKHRIIRHTKRSYILYYGDIISCLDLPCDMGYTIQIGDYYSEAMYAHDNVNKLTKFELANNKSIELIPYGLGFKQFFYLDTYLQNPIIKPFFITTKDERNNVKTNYSKYTQAYSLELKQVPNHLLEVFESFNSLESVTLNGNNISFSLLENTSIIKASKSENTCCLYDVNLELSDSNQTEISNCDEEPFDFNAIFLGIETPAPCQLFSHIGSIIIQCPTFNDGYSDAFSGNQIGTMGTIILKGFTNKKQLFGYSLANNFTSVTNWQVSAVFNSLPDGILYFFTKNTDNSQETNGFQQLVYCDDSRIKILEVQVTDTNTGDIDIDNWESVETVASNDAEDQDITDWESIQTANQALKIYEVTVKVI